MRNKNEYRMVNLRKEVYDRLVKDKAEFQRIINGGKWSFSDVITEYLKIINTK